MKNADTSSKTSRSVKIPRDLTEKNDEYIFHAPSVSIYLTCNSDEHRERFYSRATATLCCLPYTIVKHESEREGDNAGMHVCSSQVRGVRSEGEGKN